MHSKKALAMWRAAKTVSLSPPRYKMVRVQGTALNDQGFNFLRPQLITVPGAVIPYPYGGKQRQAMINMDQYRMQAKGLSPTDVLNAVNAQNLILPSGTAKIAESELDVRMNVAPRTVAELNEIPIREVGNTTSATVIFSLRSVCLGLVVFVVS